MDEQVFKYVQTHGLDRINSFELEKFIPMFQLNKISLIFPSMTEIAKAMFVLKENG